jgi:iron complex transport system substrate-binding protein
MNEEHINTNMEHANKKMKRIFFFRVIIIVMVVSFFAGCSGDNSSKNSTLPNAQSNTVYKEKMKVEYSKNFSIEYFENHKVINIFSPGEKRNLVFRYLLLPEGIEVPKGYKNAMVVRTPIKSVVSLTSLYIGFLDKLKLTGKIVAVDKFQYVSSSTANELIRAGKICEVGESFSLNIEKVFELKPGLILTYGNGNPLIDGNPKLTKNGLHVASTTIHLENSPLARAEWIKFIAAFFDYEKEANIVFNRLAQRYNNLVELTINFKNRPTVFTEAILGGMWYEPGGNSYLSKLLKDAGANYLWSDDKSTGSLKLTYEQVYEKAHNADFWINVHFWNTIDDALKNDPRNSKFRAFQTKNIFNYNMQVNQHGYYEYWENGVINCDVVLSDLIKIFHPELLPGYKMTYYKKLSNN